MKKLNEYEINSDTIAMFPLDDQRTKVMEKDEDYIIEQGALCIVENSCLCFGSTFEGRQKGSAGLIGVKYKVPIIISEEKDIIFFPTQSPRLSSCVWVSLGQLKNYYRNKSGKTILVFSTGKRVEIPETYGIIDNQYYKSIKLEKILREKKSKNRLK